MSEKIKVMYLIGGLQVGGTQKHLYDLLRFIDRSRFDASVCVFSSGGYFYERVRELGIPITSLEIDSKRTLLTRFPHFLTHLKNTRPHVLHAVLYRTSVYGCLARLLLRSRGPRLLVSKRSMNVEMDRRRSLLYRHLIMKVPDVITAVSQSVRERCLELGASEKKVRVIPNGIEWAQPNGVGELRRLLDIPPECPIVGTVGSLTLRKRHEYLLRIVPEVIRDFPQARFVILGEGSMRNRLEKLCRTLGIHRSVYLPGILSPAIEYITEFSLFTLTSSEEGMSNALLESMMAGLPCVASDIPSNREVIDSKRNGILVNVEDTSSFAQVVKQLLKNSDLRECLSISARETIKKCYPIDQMVSANQSLYANLARNGLSGH